MSILSLNAAARQVLVKTAKALVLPVAFIALWAVASQQNWVDPKLIPSPWLVLQKAVIVLQQPSFLTGFAESLARNFIGYGIGAIAGVLFGILIASSRLSNWLFAPSFHVLRQISLFAWLPLISTFLGEGHGAKVLFITLSVFYPVALHTFEGVSSISHKYREVAEVYQFPKAYAFRKLILPGASAQIFVGLQLGLIFAWLATIGSEFLLANYGNGLGNIVIQGRQAFDVELIIFGMLLIGAVGVLLNTVLTWVERKVLAWQQVG
ncbi:MULTISPECIES: ABC transporter permease [unclassified Acinetobacter]|uniref:ABC transporter permease n=1 Tax=unclassified Acinetobacter TaxID=196816 RepID=UPI0015D376A1|nr:MULTISPECIES: ABC transporter permease [unclassified Acinetobacter]